MTYVYGDLEQSSIYQNVYFFMWSKSDVLNVATFKYFCISSEKPYYSNHTEVTNELI